MVRLCFSILFEDGGTYKRNVEFLLLVNQAGRVW